MDLYEYQGKQYFARYGIPTSKGEVADTVEEAVIAAERVGYPVVVKVTYPACPAVSVADGPLVIAGLVSTVRVND